MKAFTVQDGQRQFDNLLDLAQREPVRITSDGRLVGMLVSAEDHGDMQRFLADRLRRTFLMSAEQAERAGLTSDVLKDLLSDDS
jgi:prevent-host-death family protein